MIPGKTYVGRLPGRFRKGFVRKREFNRRPILRLGNVQANQPLGPDTIYEAERRTKMPRWLRSMFGSDYDCYDDRYRKRRVAYTNSPRYGPFADRMVTGTRQACSACGKFRSPSWSARHPLTYGEVPRSSLCRKCMGKSTSSAETPYHPRRRRREYHHSHPRYSDCTEHLHSTCDDTDPRRLRRRYRSSSLDYLRPRSRVRSGSGERVNIIIQNDGRTPRPRVRTMSSSDGTVRVIHRIAVDRPARRGILRSLSSDAAYSDGLTEEVVPRRRPLSHTR